MTLQPGTRIGPYEISAVAGRGGMGEVYRALDSRLERVVAIKVLPEELSGDEQLRRRFEREAKTVSSLSHQHICALYDVGEHDGTSFLVMEFCEGETLAERLTRGPLPIDQVLRFGRQIADALDKAHRKGIVHRDLKPGNVMLTASGVKLLDFGLAKVSADDRALEAELTLLTQLPTQETPLTEEGTILGTFLYMSPEQLEGLATDSRTDLFAFGSLLFEMATGQRAFEAKSKAGLIGAILNRQPPAVSSLRPESPPALDHLVQRCLEKDPEDRWQSAHDLAAHLRWIAEAGSQVGVPAPLVRRRRSRERIAWTIAAIATLAALALAAQALLRAPEPASPPLRASLIAPRGTMFELSEIHSASLAVSPDGRSVAFTALDEDGTRQIWVRQLSEIEARPLNGTVEASQPFWSPDGRSLAFFAESKLKKIDLTGAPPIPLADAPDGRAGSWNAAGVILFSPTTLAPIHRVSDKGGRAEPVTALDEERHETTHRWAQFLPNGRDFLYTAATHTFGSSNEANAIWVASLDGGEPRRLLHTRSNAVYSAKHLLYVRDRVLVAQPFDPDRLELTGDPVPIAEGVRFLGDFFRGTFSASPGGEILVYQTGSDSRLASVAWLDRAGREIATLREATGFVNPDLSPDGGAILVEEHNRQSGTSDIYRYDLERDVASRLTFQPLSEYSPVWSPDGRDLVFSAVVDAALDVDVFRKAVAGGDETERVIDSEGAQLAVATDWSADGRYIAYSTYDSTNNGRLWVFDLEENRAITILDRNDFNDVGGIFSPDGRWLAYLSNESGRQELYATSFPELRGKWQISNGGASAIGNFPRPATWLDDEIVFRSPNGTIHSVPVETGERGLRIGSPVALFTDPRIHSFDVTRDGQRILALLVPHSTLDTPLTLVEAWNANLGR